MVLRMGWSRSHGETRSKTQKGLPYGHYGSEARTTTIKEHRTFREPDATSRSRRVFSYVWSEGTRGGALKVSMTVPVQHPLPGVYERSSKERVTYISKFRE